MKISPEIQKLNQKHQSIWYDNLSRGELNDGTLSRLIEQGVSGLTSNPSIFQKSITSSSVYDDTIASELSKGRDIETICEDIFVADVGAAADLLKPVFEKSRGADGYASLEVSPDLAHDTEGTIEAGRRLWQKLGRENVMIKVPATQAGIPAIRTLLTEGINVNITLIFSIQRYREVMEAYLQALETRHKEGKPLQQVASVASFFVSRLDALVEKQLIQKGMKDRTEQFLGVISIANCRLAYEEFLTTFNSDRFNKLKKHQARVQRPLWASTSSKSDSIAETYYVEKLTAKDTVNTLPPHTLEAVLQGVTPDSLLTVTAEGARRVVSALEETKISLEEVLSVLEAQGVSSFENSFKDLLKSVQEKAKKIS